MTRSLFSAIAAIMAVCAVFAGPVHAQDGGFIDEFRFGFVSINPEFIDADHPENDQAGLNAEVLFTEFDLDYRAMPTDGFVRDLLTPSLHVGTTVNLDSDGTSTLYGGLTWQTDLGERMFLETSFGLSANNGKRDGELDVTNTRLARARLGSNITFRESIAIGFRATERVNVILSLAHNSHAGLFDDKNRGLTNISLKTGFAF